MNYALADIALFSIALLFAIFGAYLFSGGGG